MQGLIIFRVWRDDEYIKAMLDFVSHLYTSYVLPGKDPPTNIFMNTPEYSSFLQQTSAIAEAATVVAQVPPEEVVRWHCSDQRAFLK